MWNLRLRRRLPNCPLGYASVSYLQAGAPLPGARGRARASPPGGCPIGHPPIAPHTKSLELLGAKIAKKHGYVEPTATRLRGAEIVFDKITVTGTEDLLMAATLAEGETV